MSEGECFREIATVEPSETRVLIIASEQPEGGCAQDDDCDGGFSCASSTITDVTRADERTPSCTSCHGDSGQGGQGPRLAGTVIVNYPDAADEIDIVTNGRNAMPPFALDLTEDEVVAVVTFTRFGFL